MSADFLSRNVTPQADPRCRKCNERYRVAFYDASSWGGPSLLAVGPSCSCTLGVHPHFWVDAFTRTTTEQSTSALKQFLEDYGSDWAAGKCVTCGGRHLRVMEWTAGKWWGYGGMCQCVVDWQKDWTTPEALLDKWHTMANRRIKGLAVTLAQAVAAPAELPTQPPQEEGCLVENEGGVE